jgi:nucleotide-binding universal stress UspA family protein
MKTILIPTEFSDATESLVETGIVLSTDLNSKMSLLYSIVPMHVSTASPHYALYDTRVKAAQKDKMRALDHYQELFIKFKNRLPDNINLELILERGERIDNIIATANNLETEMVILPNEHEGIIEKLLGESNNRIIQSVNAPVFIKSGKKSFKPPENIAFLLDYDISHRTALSKLKQLKEAFQCSMHVLHSLKNNESNLELILEGSRKELTILFGDGGYSEHFVDPGNQVDNIAALNAEIGFDLLVLVNKSENMLQQWFTFSTNEKLMDNLNIPTIVYHSDSEG